MFVIHKIYDTPEQCMQFRRLIVISDSVVGGVVAGRLPKVHHVRECIVSARHPHDVLHDRVAQMAHAETQVHTVRLGYCEACRCCLTALQKEPSHFSSFDGNPYPSLSLVS